VSDCRSVTIGAPRSVWVNPTAAKVISPDWGQFNAIRQR